MRTYECHFFYYNKNKELVKCGNYACWGDVQSFIEGRDSINEIYIDRYDEETTIKHQRRLIAIINKVTPCKKVIIDNKKYIKFRNLDTYVKSLTLLTFIRNLWFEPLAGYTERFFVALRDSRKKYKDALQRLTWANIEASQGASYYNCGHSACYMPSRLKIKTTKQLMKAAHRSMESFLTTD